MTTSDAREGPRQRTTVETLTFSNAGSAPCQMGGERPVRSTTAQFVRSDKTSTVGQPAIGYGGDFSLAPGESFATTLTTNSIFGVDDERCGEAPVGGVQLFAPIADAVAVTVPARLAVVCTNPTFGSFLEVGALPARG